MVFNFHFVFKIKIQLIQFINNSSDKKNGFWVTIWKRKTLREKQFVEDRIDDLFELIHSTTETLAQKRM